MPAPRGPRAFPWFRLYVELMQDHKIKRAPVATRWTWVAVLSLARKSPEAGRLLLSEGLPVTLRHVADEANVSLKAARTAVDHFTDRRMLHDEAGVWVVTHWGKRQPASDNVTERVQRFRAHERNVSSGSNETLQTSPRGREREETETEAEPTTSEVQPGKTESKPKTSAIARARDLAIVPVNGQAKSEQVALLKAAEIAFGHVGQTDTEKRRHRGYVHELATADPPVTLEEFQELVAEYRRRGWTNPSLQAIVKNLAGLRSPYDRGRKVAERDEPRGFAGIREAFADLRQEGA